MKQPERTKKKNEEQWERAGERCNGRKGISATVENENDIRGVRALNIGTVCENFIAKQVKGLAGDVENC